MQIFNILEIAVHGNDNCQRVGDVKQMQHEKDVIREKQKKKKKEMWLQILKSKWEQRKKLTIPEKLSKLFHGFITEIRQLLCRFLAL